MTEEGFSSFVLYYKTKPFSPSCSGAKFDFIGALEPQLEFTGVFPPLLSVRLGGVSLWWEFKVRHTLHKRDTLLLQVMDLSVDQLIQSNVTRVKRMYVSLIRFK